LIGINVQLVAWKDGDNKLLVDPEEIDCLTRVSSLNTEAESIYDLYNHSAPLPELSTIWKDITLSPARASLQMELRDCVQRIENPTHI
jgi:hypothetical protein